MIIWNAKCYDAPSWRVESTFFLIKIRTNSTQSMKLEVQLVLHNLKHGSTTGCDELIVRIKCTFHLWTMGSFTLCILDYQIWDILPLNYRLLSHCIIDIWFLLNWTENLRKKKWIRHVVGFFFRLEADEIKVLPDYKTKPKCEQKDKIKRT